ncbi:MAG: isoprenylcysteine carboxylmethyltransferase family protein [Deltaproteobacteria bacterium]|nr:isoprenylcysteine carboxylmethyltransferase family protein [Deltaproteobacteria bacterium]
MSLRKRRVQLLRLAFVPVIFIAIFVRPSWSTDSTVAFVIELFGYLFLLGGLTIRIWCTFYIGNRKSKEIIAQGPYSICRNPLYIGTLLLAIGLGLCFENLLIFLLVPMIIIPVHIIATRMEETHLESKFGEQYRAYKQKVPRLWPRFSNYSSPDVIEINVHSIRRIALDTTGILLLPKIENGSVNSVL